MLASGPACADAAGTNDSGSDNAGFSSSDEFTTDPHFIAVRGTFPETIDQEWGDSVTKCWQSIDSYVEFGPSVYDIDCAYALEVSLYSDYQGKINESNIDEIYRKINDHCEQEEGISDIPVVFMWVDEEDMPIIPDYGPKRFEEARINPSVIAVYGTMPVIEQISEK